MHIFLLIKKLTVFNFNILKCNEGKFIYFSNLTILKFLELNKHMDTIRTVVAWIYYILVLNLVVTHVYQIKCINISQT